jgi:hypothetical protein
MTHQETFCGIDYGFRWTSDGWYKWDGRAGDRAALKARNARAKKLRQQGRTVRLFALGPQLVSRGGIGSGQPHIELVAKCYGLNVY